MSRDGYIEHVQDVMDRDHSTLREEVERWRRETRGMGPLAKLTWWTKATTTAQLSTDFPEVLGVLRSREHSEATSLEVFERAIDEALAVANNRPAPRRARAARVAA